MEKFTPGGVHIFLNTFFAILHTLFVLKSVIAYTNIFQQNLLSSYGYEMCVQRHTFVQIAHRIL